MSMCLLKEAKINTDYKRSSNLHSTVFLWKDKQLKNCYFKAFIFHIIDNYISTYFSKNLNTFDNKIDSVYTNM